MYVAMDRNLDNGVEIHNAAYGRSGVIIRLSIFKSANNEEEHKYYEDNLPHGTKLLKELVIPWAKMDRILCADSYFSSVPAAEELWKHGLRLIGVINTVTRQFPMAYLSKIEFHNWVDMSGFLTRPVDRTNTVLGAFVWMDRNRQYFVFTGGFMEKGRPYTCIQWR